MPTLQEILDKDLGLGSEQVAEKVAAQNSVAENDDIEKLAQEVGLGTTEIESASSETTEGQKKEARMSLDNLYNEMFPGDADIVKVAGAPVEKVAEQDKAAAAIEEAKGEFAFDKFAGFVDGHISKIAQEVVEQSEKSAGTEPPRTMDNNAVNSDAPISTKPTVTNIVTPQSGAEVVGDEKAQAHPNGALKTAALKKHLLLAGLSA